MSETSLFVPVIESENGEKHQSLYHVQTSDSDIRHRWSIFGTVDKKYKEKLENCFSCLGIEIDPIQFSVYRHEDRFPLKNTKESSENMQSVFLGLFLAAYQHFRHLSFNGDWDSIVVTGDLDVRDDNIYLNAVGGIDDKFTGVKKYAENAPDKNHLFIYVSNEKPIAPGQYGNITVKAFESGSILGAIVADLFECRFDAKQKNLFRKAEVDKPPSYILTPAFDAMKKEALSPQWKGFLIHGEGETGKSMAALELAEYLASAEWIYAPLWVRFENEQEQIFEKPEPIMDHSQKPDPLRNPITAYIAHRIAAALEINWTVENGLYTLARELDRGKTPYLLIIDNLERDYADEVIDAVKIILDSTNNGLPLILTSRFDEKEAGYAQRKLGLVTKTQDDLKLSSVDEIKSLVDAVSKGQEYEPKIAKKKGSEEYEDFIGLLYRNFASFPGAIIQTAASLKGFHSLSELIPCLISMNNLDLTKKLAASYYLTFSQLDRFTQAVLFAFIAVIARETTKEVFEYIHVDNNKIADQIFCSGWLPPESQSSNNGDFGFVDSSMEIKIKEKLPDALATLVRSHLIYERPQLGSDGETEYAIKSLPYTIFLFDQSFEGEAVESLAISLRDTIVDNTIDIVATALYYNQSISVLEKLLCKLQLSDKQYSQYALLAIAARYSDIPEHIDLLLQYGYSLNVQWERANSRNAIQCAAFYNTNPAILQKLIDEGANYKVRDESGETLLHLAAQNNENPEIISMLIDRGLDMYAKNKKRWTPLQYAVWNPNPAIIKMFCEKGARLNTIFHDGNTLLHHAAFSENSDILRLLIDQGLDHHMHAITKDGWTPLHCAVLVDNNTEVIAFLLENGALSEINAMYDTEPKKASYLKTVWAPLHLAAVNNTTRNNIDLLVKKGAEINLKDPYGDTPLHVAATFNNDPRMIAFLLDHGANIDEKNSGGKTPVFKATFNKNPEVAIALIKAGARLDDEVYYTFLFRRKDTARKRLKKRKDWPFIKEAVGDLL